jgi:hypothetical protein
MRVPALILALTTFALGTAASQSPLDSRATDAACRPTGSHVAAEKTPYRGQKLTPRKLTELPPATTYMAVFRHIGDCEAPLTMSDYRNPRRR